MRLEQTRAIPSDGEGRALSPGSVTDGRGDLLSQTMGFDIKGGARNRASLFASAGIEWPDGYDPEREIPRYNDYPFSVDLSNNRILASVDRSGNIRRAVVGEGLRDARGSEAPGVYTSKLLAYFEGTCGLFMTVDGCEIGAPSLGFGNNLIPIYSYSGMGMTIAQRLFVPKADSGCPTSVCSLIEVRNESESQHSFTVRSKCRTTRKTDWPELTARLIMLRESGRSASSDAWMIDLQAGASAKFGFVCLFAGRDVSLDAPEWDYAHLVSELQMVKLGLKGTQGVLDVPEMPWVGDELTRAKELSRQSVLMLPDGAVIGSFWGSNVNPKPDVWMRDFSYTTLGLVDSDPGLAYRCAKYLCMYSSPKDIWDPADSKGEGESSFRHSLGNACMGAVVLSMLRRRYGALAVDVSDPIIIDYLHQLADCMIENMPPEGSLYPTTYISDGLSRGDFHTGSNILAWRAIVAMSEDFRELFGSQTLDLLTSLGIRIKAAIDTICIGSFGEGKQFVEGMYSNKDPVSIHDAEESDIALSGVYGFTKRDDCRVINHMVWALGLDNPYYARTTGGVDYWDFDGSNGVSYPGHICLLKRCRNKHDLMGAFEEIRRTTDLDGSFWWWPFKHDEPDMDRIKRGLGKCGWSSGEFVSILLHDVIGISCNAAEESLTFAPYTPWKRFSLTGFGFLDGEVNFKADEESLMVDNLTNHALKIGLQLCMRPQAMLEDVQLNGESRRLQARVVRLFDSSSVFLQETIGAGRTAYMKIRTS